MDKLFTRLAHKLGVIYHPLGVLLGIPPNKIQQLEKDYQFTSRITFEVLNIWKEKASKKADSMGMVHVLTKALRDLDQNLVADEIIEGEFLQG